MAFASLTFLSLLLPGQASRIKRMTQAILHKSKTACLCDNFFCHSCYPIFTEERNMLKQHVNPNSRLKLRLKKERDRFYGSGAEDLIPTVSGRLKEGQDPIPKKRRTQTLA